jgi:tRNA acetyltransferase TAN1
MSRKGGAEARGIQPGDVGIWATCDMKKEAKSVAELRDLFQDVCSVVTWHRRLTNPLSR